MKNQNSCQIINLLQRGSCKDGGRLGPRAAVLYARGPRRLAWWGVDISAATPLQHSLAHSGKNSCAVLLKLEKKAILLYRAAHDKITVKNI